ncbi:MAG: FG-GAP repeat domain-containing protein [Thermoanaerobaculia bacterium]
MTDGILGRRFSREGTPLSDTFQFSRPSQPKWGQPAVARDGHGDFVAVWQAQDRDGPYEDIYAQRVSASGEKIGRIFTVNSIRESAQRYPTVASDKDGNFVIVWQGFDPKLDQFHAWHLRGQLFRKDGSRVGKEFVIPNPGADNSRWEPEVVFGPNGTFLLHYKSDIPVMIRRYAASPADEPCLWTGNAVRCDTGRTGGEAELPLALRLFPGDVPLLGDVDGDGREDLCVRRGRGFSCDTDQGGGKLEWEVRFGTGARGEVPLMGDVNGDGKAEACVRTGRQLQCDTARNGGKPEWTVTFGEPSDLPLLGDVDGDGRDEICVFRAGKFLCDTKHDGGAAEVTITFGAAGDLPVLGDYDGDGRDDPCVFRAGEILCDTAHDGGAAEARLFFGRNGDRPLFGNLDGL